ncbi:MAG: Flp pilus assembly protein CpaB [Methylococcales bacterium]
MNKRFIILLSVALLLAFFASRIVNNLLIQSRESQIKTVPVVAAAVDIPYGVKIDESQLKLIDWPSDSVPPGAFSAKEQVVNKVAKNNFYAGEPLSEKRMSVHTGGSTFSSLISKEYRAISVRVDDVVGVAGFILPGNFVDVLATKMDRILNQAVTQTKLQNIKVLAVDQDDSHEKDKPAIVRAVTLELKPEQAEIIVGAMQEGTIQLTLRNPEDLQVVTVKEKVEKVALPPLPQPLEKKAPPQKKLLKVIPW